jgi:hypothetical protein
MDPAERYRCRRIYLKQSDDPAFQAHSACDALSNIEGVLLASPAGSHSLHVIYSLDKLSFEIVVELLNELEFETADSLLISLRNTIFGFLEDNARDNMLVDVTEFQHVADETPEVPPQQDNEKYWDDYH